MTGAGPATWTYGYDKTGNLTAVTDPNAKKVTMAYDGLDRLKTFTDERLMMADSNAQIVWQASWQAFGGVQAITGSASNDRRFPGQWFQLETGLHDNWHRHYDPSTARYMQPDPLGMPDGPRGSGIGWKRPVKALSLEHQSATAR